MLLLYNGFTTKPFRWMEHTLIVFNLDKLLIQRKMQSVELAEELGCTVQTISRIKTGKIRAFRIETINALCEFFNCQPGDIIEYVDEEEAERRYGAQYVEDYKAYFGQE